MNYAVLGYGCRGGGYAQLFSQEGIKAAAVCEKRPERLEKAGRNHNLPKDKLFLSDKEFFKAGKLADLCVVSTQDGQHMGHAVAALEAGYDLLLEKPIATNFADCDKVYQTAKKLKRKVFVCHVLRYAPFFSLIKKELQTGKYGKIATVNLTENIAYWHFAHSYVRGNWSVVPPAAPMIIAKTCHDLDIICWLTDAKCKTVSSMGNLGFYTKENAPKGSGERCLDCAVKAGCLYDAERYYLLEEFEKKGNTGWPVDVLCEEPTKIKLLEALKNGPYGRCVWKCGNNAADRQVVNMDFEGGATAHLTATAFARGCYREIHVHCERGEIFGNMDDNILTCNIFGGETKKIEASKFAEGMHGHGGGDGLLIKDVVAAYGGQKAASLTSIENSIQSHAIGFAAEESRLSGGKLVTI